MKIVCNTKHHLHSPQYEFYLGTLTEHFEVPRRVDLIVTTLIEHNIGPLVNFETYPLETLSEIHDEEYVHFLKNGYQDWISHGFTGNACAGIFNVQHPRSICSRHIVSQLAQYTADGGVPL